MRKLLIPALFAVPLVAQAPLSLQDAVQLGLKQHPSLLADRSGVEAAQAKIGVARGGYLPRVNYTESLTRSNNPVFVFSSLLTQHQFTEANFAIGPLNRPEPLSNFQSLVTADQTIFDAGRTKTNVRAARLGHNMTQEELRHDSMQVIANTVRAYDGTLLASEALNVAREAVRSAEADLKRARAIRQAGLSTEADVLSLEVHLASMREQEIRRSADLDVARAALNEAVGLPLDTPHDLTTPLTVATLKGAELPVYEKESVEYRPEARQARLAVNLAETQKSLTKSSYWPEIAVHGAFEVDRQTFADRGGANWTAMVSLRWNLFNGFSDKARVQEAAYAVQRAQALRSQAESQLRLNVRRAWADFRAAGERVDVTQAAVAQAEESLRITKNRFDAGLTSVTDLLRNETAVLEARNRRLAAIYDQRLAAVNLALAAGTLSPASEALL